MSQRSDTNLRDIPLKSYDLLREGLITGRKPKPDSGVSVWYVNVESVENYKLKMVRKKLLKEKI